MTLYPVCRALDWLSLCEILRERFPNLGFASAPYQQGPYQTISIASPCAIKACELARVRGFADGVTYVSRHSQTTLPSIACDTPTVASPVR